MRLGAQAVENERGLPPGLLASGRFAGRIGGKLNKHQPELIRTAVARMPVGSEIVAAMDADPRQDGANGHGEMEIFETALSPAQGTARGSGG
jgi:hypothetical protein